MQFDIRKAMTNAIKETQDPLAHIKLQEAYKSCAQVGKMLTVMTTPKEVEQVTYHLLAHYNDYQLAKPNPAMIVALCSCLCEALIVLGRKFADDPTL